MTSPFMLQPRNWIVRPLREIYDRVAKEPVPRDMLDLLAKLK